MIRLRTPSGRARQTGAMLLEALLAVLLLGVCLAPAMHSLLSGVAALRIAREASRETGCLQYAMERVLAHSYVDLLSAAASKSPAPGVFTNPTSHSLLAGAACPASVSVYILRYNPSLSDPFASTSDEMLYLRAVMRSGASVGTLVIRR